MAEHEYDVVVIGAGPTGENVADRAVAQIEAALETVRGGGHAPREDYFERQLARARALAQRLRTSSPPR